MDLKARTEAWVWWQRIKNMLTRNTYQDKLKGVEKFDHSCRGIYPDDVRTMNEQLEKQGTAMAMAEKFGLAVATQVTARHRTCICTPTHVH